MPGGGPAVAPGADDAGEIIGRTQDLLLACQSRRSMARWRQAYAAADDDRSVTLARIAYADQQEEGAGKAMDFSAATVRSLWDAGHRDGDRMIDRLLAEPALRGKRGLTLVE